MSDVRILKDKVYEELAKVASAMANPRRMEILDILGQGAFPVEDIAKHSNMSIANTSQHLQILKNARLVTSEKRGNYVYYRIVSERAFHAWESVRDLGVELNSEISKLIADYKKGDPTLIATTGEDLIARIEAGEVILLDVNSEEVFNRAHIHKAISIPLDQLKKRIAELSKDKEIVAYCRGALCLLSDEAVELLRAEGFNVRKLVREIPDWIENYSGIVINQK